MCFSQDARHSPQSKKNSDVAYIPLHGQHALI